MRFFSRDRRASLGHSSWNDDDLAELVLVLQKLERCRRTIEREAALDHRLEPLLLHESHHGFKFIQVTNIRSYNIDILKEKFRRVDGKLQAAGRAVDDDSRAHRQCTAI